MPKDAAAVRAPLPRRRPSPRPRRPTNPAELRAVKAASEPRPRQVPPFLVWVIGRLVALAVLLGAAWLVYDSASSDRFEVRSIGVQGNLLLSRADVEGALAVTGANVFWVDRTEAAARLGNLPLVKSAEVEPVLPDSVQVRIVERQPAAFWVSGDQVYLVDGEGVILRAVDADTAQTRACAGQPCDPRLAPLLTVADLDAQPRSPGDRVNASVLSTAVQLANLLPRAGIEPLAFRWSSQAGLEVPTQDGWRARFDGARDLQQQVRSLATVREYLTRTGTTAELIDVRFGDRPYYR